MMKKQYTTPEVIIRGTIEDITKGGRLPPFPWGPGGSKNNGKDGHHHHS